MCGISGCLELKQGATPDRAAIKAMTSFMAHRGPDDAGFFHDGPVALGHRRLSIIDLGGGHQPMLSPCGRYALVFNGEIYNYIELRQELAALGVAFETSSDSEVLLQAIIRWGTDVLARLNGMFAFALWDRQEQSLLLARDHLGVKPLFWYRDSERVLFASEVGALAVHPSFPRRLCEKALSHFFTWRVVPVPYTIFENASHLPPGSYLKITADGRMTQRGYWDVPVLSEPGRMKAEVAEQKLRELLEDALRLQVRSDVPVGAFLSGGVDSSTVAHFMAKACGGRGLTFTIGFQGEEADFDESRWAAEVAESIGTEHHLHVLQQYDIVGLLERIAWYYGQPCGTGVPNYFVSAMARRHVKVALAGVGGDECFGGYGRFQAASNPAALGFATTDPIHAFLRSLVSFTEQDKDRFFTQDFFARVAGEPSIEFIRSQSNHVPDSNVMDKLCYIDLRHFMLNDLLFNLDKMSMAHSLEVRVPLLDYRIVELAMQVPSYLKVLHGEHKLLLKRAMYRLLPRQVFLRAKRGFSLPKQVWLKKIEDFVRSLINERAVRERGLFRWPEVEGYLNTVFAADGRASWRDANNLWNLFTFELWARQFLDRAPSLAPPGGDDAAVRFDQEPQRSGQPSVTCV